jgi:hypothetical protein
MDPLHLNENDPRALDFMTDEADSSPREREIFGRRSTMPLDELRIFCNSTLSLNDKVERLTALRQSKTTRRATARRAARSPQLTANTFQDRISAADQIRARGLGIRLE